MKTVILLSFLFFFNGCIGTVGTFNEPKVYSATRLEVNTLKNEKEWGTDGQLNAMIKAVVLGIDLPFSILFDTILLPYKTYLIINEEDELVITKSTNKT